MAQGGKIMMLFKKRQIIVVVLILMIIVAGYLQYTYKKSSASYAGNDGKLGEAVYVDSGDEIVLGDEPDVADVEAKDAVAKTGETDSDVSVAAVDYFTQAKLDKEVSRSKNVDTLKQITEDENAGEDLIAAAFEKMITLVDNSEKEMRIETLLKEKGFGDVLMLFADDGSIDLIIKASSLSTAQIAQISDLVSRQALVEIDKLHIKNIF